MEVFGDLEQEQAIDDLQKWFEDNKKLPNKINRILLKRLYLCSSWDTEETKKLLLLNYSIRHKSPHIFINRDPTDGDSHHSYAYTDMLPLLGLTPENYHITFIRFFDPDPNTMHFTEHIKAYMMINDCFTSMPDLEMGDGCLLSEGEVLIADLDGISMKHVARFSIFTMSTIFKFLHQAFPGQIKAIHMINCPSFVNKVLAVIRPFMNKELFEMIHCHMESLETLYDYVPQEILPDKYGGNAGTICDLKERLQKTLSEKRDYLMDPDYWRIQNTSYF